MVRGLIRLLFLALVLVGAVMLGLRVPGLAEAVLPDGAVNSLHDWGLVAQLAAQDTAPDREEPPAGAAVEDHLADTFAGLVATGKIAAMAGNRPVFIDQVIAGHDRSTALSVPAEYTTVRPILGCRPTQPMAGSLVGHVAAGESGMSLGMVTYGDQHLAEAVQAFVDAYRRVGPQGVITLDGPRFDVYDVVVTETKAPVYLVLETRKGSRIWNIHMAEGARIERVVLLGGDQAGVANLDPLVPVEMILGPGLADCGIAPAYAPTAGQQADKGPAPGFQPMTQDDLDEAMGRAETYDIWFRDSFGVKAGESRVGFDAGTVSVIGPFPTGEVPRPVWTSVSGSRLRATQDRYLDIEGQVAAGQDFEDRVRAIATGFAFGDLGVLALGGSF